MQTDTMTAGTVAVPEGGPALPSRISWGAVLAGGLVAAALAASLNILGAAIGATTIDAVRQGTPFASTLGIGAVIWLILANSLALGVGGYIAARLSGTADNTDGILHGLAVWALAFLLSAVIVGNLVAGVARTTATAASEVVGGVASGAGSAVSGIASQASPEALLDRARQTLAGAGGDPQAMTTEQRGAEITTLLTRRATSGTFTDADRQRLSTLVAAEAGVTPEEATRRIQVVEREAQQAAAEAERRAREAADAAARATSFGAFGTFGALLLGAIAAVFGAISGTREWQAIGRRRPVAPRA
jgi:hypothetical protein